jgi:hypothetical protein
MTALARPSGYYKQIFSSERMLKRIIAAIVQLKKNYWSCVSRGPIIVAVPLDRSKIGIVSSNITRGMNVYMSLFCVRFVLCVGSGLSTG